MRGRGRVGGRAVGHRQRGRRPDRRGRGAAEDPPAGPPLARRVLRRRLPLGGRRRPPRRPAPHRQRVVGPLGGDQRVRHPGVPPLLQDDRRQALPGRQRRQRQPAGAEGVGRVLQLRRRQHPRPTARRQRVGRAVRRLLLGRGQRGVGVRRVHVPGGLRRRVQAVRHLPHDVRPPPGEHAAVPHRLRTRRQRPGLDPPVLRQGAACPAATGPSTASPPTTTAAPPGPTRPVRRRPVVRTAAPRRRRRGADPPAAGGHGRVRPATEDRADPRRMGHVAPRPPPAATPSTSGSRTPCATRWSPPSPSTPSTATPTSW